MAESTLFQESGLQITRRRVVLDGQQYMLDAIRSVQLETVRMPRSLVIPAALFGIGSLLVSQANGSLLWMVAALAAFAGLGLLWWRASRTFILVIGTTEGDKPILTSTDRRLIERAAQTIDALLVERDRR